MTDSQAAWEIDPYSEAVLVDPYAYYAELRARGPLLRIGKYGVWAAGRHAVVQAVFSDWKRFCSSRGIGLSDFKKEKPWRPPSIILEVDPPEHTRTRNVMARALSPMAVERLRTPFAAEARSLVDRLIQVGRFDVVPDLAEAYPLKVFPDAVGLDEEGRENFLTYGTMVFNAVGPDNFLRRNSLARAGAVVPWINAKCARSALAPQGFGAAIYAAVEGGEITEDEAALLVRSLLSAGVDTTVATLGNAVSCFAIYPDQWRRLRDNPALVKQAVEEVLRFESPVHTFARTASVNTEVAGVPVREGDKILCVLAAANRDPDKWSDPDTFDIGRRPAGHLAFGVGIHGCVGQAVARLEAEVVLTAMAERISSIEQTGRSVWRPGNSVRSLASLPVEILPR